MLPISCGTGCAVGAEAGAVTVGCWVNICICPSCGCAAGAVFLPFGAAGGTDCGRAAGCGCAAGCVTGCGSSDCTANRLPASACFCTFCIRVSISFCLSAGASIRTCFNQMRAAEYLRAVVASSAFFRSFSIFSLFSRASLDSFSAAVFLPPCSLRWPFPSAFRRFRGWSVRPVPG